MTLTELIESVAQSPRNVSADDVTALAYAASDMQATLRECRRILRRVATNTVNNVAGSDVAAVLQRIGKFLP